MFVKGAWIVFNGSGGELDRIFVPFGDEDDTGPLITRAIQAKVNSYDWSLYAGDTLAVEEGESEI